MTLLPPSTEDCRTCVSVDVCQVAEETLSGDDARVEYNARGIRCDFPPRRRRFFRGLDTETVQFVHGVLRRAQRHEAGRDNRSDIVGNDESSLEALKVPEAAEATGGEIQQPSLLQERPRVNEGLLHAFTQRTAARRRETMLCLALRDWSALVAQLRNARAKVNICFESKQRACNIVAQREALMAFRRFAASKKRAREAAEEILVGRRAAMARGALLALAMNLEKSRALKEAARALKSRVSAAEALRAKSRVMAALSQACGDAKVVQRRAEDLREVGLDRLLIKAFQAWAMAAGLSGRLRNRLTRADQALLENVMSAWALFTQYSINKRARREERTVRRANRAWDAEVLEIAFFDWANATAAGKFRRLRLSSRVLHGWREATKASTAAGNEEIQLPRERR